jgi:hypothetical protein
VPLLTKLQTARGPRWAIDGRLLAEDFQLGRLLNLPAADMWNCLDSAAGGEAPGGTPLAPVETTSEVWAAGVTYLRSRVAREAESTVKDVYAKVYEAERPELFFKAPGWRVAGHGMPIRIRRDSRWNVPEPELTLVVNARGEIVGFCAGNDVSSRDIEGANPLYLPQAKVYNGSCALGPGIILCGGVGPLNESRMVALAPESGADLRRDVDAIATHDGCRDAGARDRRLPRDVLGRAPAGWEPLVGRDTAPIWSAPTGPVAAGRLRVQRQGSGQEGHGQDKGPAAHDRDSTVCALVTVPPRSRA